MLQRWLSPPARSAMRARHAFGRPVVPDVYSIRLGAGASRTAAGMLGPVRERVTITKDAGGAAVFEAVVELGLRQAP